VARKFTCWLHSLRVTQTCDGCRRFLSGSGIGLVTTQSDPVLNQDNGHARVCMPVTESNAAFTTTETAHLKATKLQLDRFGCENNPTAPQLKGE
jgi:hypothetical protein